MSIRIVVRCLAFVCALHLFACQRVNLRDGLVKNDYPLLESGLYIASSVCLQNLTVRSDFSPQVSHYQLVYDASASAHQLIILSTVGQRLVTVSHSGEKVSIEKGLPMTVAFQPKELLVAMQLIYWPQSILQEGLFSSGWRIVEDDKSRSVYKGDDLLVKIVYQGAHGCAGTVEYSLAGGDKLFIQGVSF